MSTEEDCCCNVPVGVEGKTAEPNDDVTEELASFGGSDGDCNVVICDDKAILELFPPPLPLNPTQEAKLDNESSP